MSAKAPRCSRERAVRPPSLDGGHLASRLRLKPSRAQDEGDAGLQARASLDVKQRQLRRLVAELQARWQQAPDHLGHALDGLYLAYLIGLQGAHSLDYELQRLGAEGAAPLDRAHESCWAGERPRVRAAPTRPPPVNSKIPRKAGARASPPERRPGRRGARHSGCGPPEPTATVDEPSHPQGGRKARASGKKAPGRPPPRNDPEPRPQAQPGGQRWLLDALHAKRAEAQAVHSACQGRGRWQQELELAFEELLDTNRRLKKHLLLHLHGALGPDQNPREEPSAHGRLRTAHPQAETGPAAGTRHADTIRRRMLPGERESRGPPLEARAPARTETQPPAPRPGGRTELPQLDALRTGSSLALSMQEPMDKAGLVAAVQLPKLDLEQRKWNHLELLEQTEQLEVNLESQSTAKELEERRRPVSPAVASRALGSTPYLTSRELGSTTHLTSRELGSTTKLTTQELGSTTHLTARELGSTTHLTARELGSTTHLTSRALGSITHLASRELGSTTFLASRELGSNPPLASQELGNTPHLASQELGSTPPLTSQESRSTLHLNSQESGSTLHLNSQESGSTFHLTSQESGSASGLSSPCLASLLTSPEQGEEAGAKSPLGSPLAQPRRQPRDLQQQRQQHQQFLEEARKRLREFQDAG